MARQLKREILVQIRRTRYTNLLASKSAVLNRVPCIIRGLQTDDKTLHLIYVDTVGQILIGHC